uniref:Uncharacterized protein n=1 Tax=Chromera velia CCMP2878 TaxID=1169474 RepID=A0A0G4GMA8_9ALVE|eukprot:Cvel_22529.t1-p1 / transcript=Cvel_22529.t1 / gene=Cvel_22529 / organism=Chromera_velia_CCMP2878 / gene_product=S-antigen protein, putative / transcript_product=S-antigen protein, putative / location=Cvel_scaffold2223:23802-24707(-) / protein_length=302 / sequence_SO=supercontig / SO=protein_coding / is_pseudo=false
MNRALQAGLKEERKARESADDNMNRALQAGLKEETKARESLDDNMNRALQAGLKEERKARESADNNMNRALQAGLKEETKARESPDDNMNRALQAGLKEERKARESADDNMNCTLHAGLKEERKARESIDQQLEERVKKVEEATSILEQVVDVLLQPPNLSVTDVLSGKTVLSILSLLLELCAAAKQAPLVFPWVARGVAGGAVASAVMLSITTATPLPLSVVFVMVAGGGATLATWHQPGGFPFFQGVFAGFAHVLLLPGSLAVTFPLTVAGGAIWGGTITLVSGAQAAYAGTIPPGVQDA